MTRKFSFNSASGLEQICFTTFTTLVLAIVTNDLLHSQGTATVLVSAWTSTSPWLRLHVYGWIPDNLGTHVNFIPDLIPTQIAARGGAQGFLARLGSEAAMKDTSRRFNSDLIQLPHHLWGADGV
ncbi:hypothetical protein CEK25_011657 [Fusarium fujikuroi]|nr:hypothetical protein CEK25_011657 [Fusarium fujikuroi]